MNWYITKLVFQIVNNSNMHQFDEQLRIIKATDYNEAIEKALQIGRMEEDEFLNVDNHKVYWKFKAITHLSHIQNMESGSELCSQIIEKTPQDRYLETITLKHNEITTNLVAVSN